MSGPLLHANLEWSLIHVGIGNKSLFKIDFDNFGCLLPRTWFKSLWKFTHLYDIKNPATEYTLQLQKAQDQFLMEAFYTQGYRKTKLKRLNKCRLFLQVSTLSDILDGTGNQFCKLYYEGKKDPYRKSTLDWPEQRNPGDSDWASWRQAIRKSFPRVDTVFSELLHPLGPWVAKSKANWKWFYSPIAQKLYTKDILHNRWKVYTRVHSCGPVRKRNLF